MTWQWQPLLPGAAQLQAGGSTAYSAVLDPATFAYTGSSLTAVTARFADLSPASLAYTGQNLGAVVGRLAALDPASFLYTGQDLDGVYVDNGVAVNYSAVLSPASFTFTGASLEADATGQAAPIPLGPGWGERTYRLEWRDRKWVKRKEREDELSNLIRQVYARLSGETETAEAEAVETAAAEVAEVLAPYTVEESIDWEGLEANARAIADLEDALEAYIKARDEEEDFLLLMAA